MNTFVLMRSNTPLAKQVANAITQLKEHLPYLRRTEAGVHESKQLSIFRCSTHVGRRKSRSHDGFFSARCIDSSGLPDDVSRRLAGGRQGVPRAVDRTATIGPEPRDSDLVGVRLFLVT